MGVKACSSFSIQLALPQRGACANTSGRANRLANHRHNAVPANRDERGRGRARPSRYRRWASGGDASHN